MPVILPLAVGLLAAPLVALIGLLRPSWVPPSAAAAGLVALVCTIWGWAVGGGAVDFAWAPSLGLSLLFSLDGLAALYALLATGIGFAVLVYANGYLPHHLAEQERPTKEQVRFYAFLLLFMGAMMGLAFSLDLLVLFIFWDLTAITSYFLIGYDEHDPETRFGASTALLVTGITSILFLIGAVLLYVEYGTFSLPALLARAQPGPVVTAAGLLIVVAAVAKSAQVPFHFWLPRAMAAPTPVSAYLHSAAMVAAGVFVLQRVYPLLLQSEVVLGLLLAIGLLSIFVGGIIALTRDVLKQVLAYSTIAQYGYVVALLGLGGAAGLNGSTFYVLAHALAKSALFLTAGAITQVTGEDRLSNLGALGRSLPWLAVGSGLAAADLAAIPLTVGFFKDELLFAATSEHGWPISALMVAGTSLTFAYTWRFWAGIFLGRGSGTPHRPGWKRLAPVLGLGLIALAGGIFVGPFADLAESAAEAAWGQPSYIELSYHLTPRPENFMALATYTVGALLIASERWWAAPARAFATLGAQVGAEHWYRALLSDLRIASEYIHGWEIRDLRGRVWTVLVPTAILVGLSLVVTASQSPYTFGTVQAGDVPLILALLLSAVAAILATFSRSQLTLVLMLSAVGYSLAVVFTFLAAPDVALVAVLVETMLTLLFLGVLGLFPRAVLRESSASPTRPGLLWRDAFLATVSGAFMLAFAWATLSQPAPTTVAAMQIALAPEAHARDIVSAILADFRGLDTMGEITVIAIALIGVVALLRGGRLW
ncbi:MAG: proton-conducting transporter membrane subunit [Dehalococcoidales bacterium]|nr:proton-conducting transporter membrane subunit [Dehalococcoidales bacterium]